MADKIPSSNLRTTLQPHSNGTKHASSSSPPPSKAQPIVIDDDTSDVKLSKDELDPSRVAQAKVRYEADLKKHHYEPPAAARIQDDWQVAYVWAFIVKFQQLERIRKLECLEDFENCLLNPMAIRPDDIFEGILIRFLGNLKPGSKSINCTNIQKNLSEYISTHLRDSPEFTVWDRPWAPNEEARGSCCNDSEDRTELGRLRYSGEPVADRVKKNPILQVESKGGGLFELDWKDRAKLLRQLVDWQLTHAESIRGIIGREYKLNDNNTKKVTGLDTSIITLPIGQDRDKARIWSFDDSGRLYKSGNPFKRPCPLVSITTNRADMNELKEQYTTHGAQSTVKPKGSGPKGKLTPAEGRAYAKLAKGVEDERKLAEKLEAMEPAIEKEEQRVLRQRRKIAAAVQLAQQAEFRSTRTRRSTKKIDYTYGDESDPDEPSSKRSRTDEPTWEGSSTRGRVVIPGERRSARVTALQEQDEENGDGRDEGSEVSAVPDDGVEGEVPPLSAKTAKSNGSNGSNESRSISPAKRVQGAAGWEWVEDGASEKRIAGESSSPAHDHHANGNGGVVDVDMDQ